MKYKFITHNIHDPSFNLASEEYLLKRKGGYYIYLWKNSPAVIVGVNQNTLQEVNLAFTEEHGIKVIRRLTGGGAVYHDLNNLCYTVIAPFEEGTDSYRKFTGPVIEYLRSMGVNAEFSGRNDVTVNGKKISGNAQTVFEGRIMHHGTLLFDTDMDTLEKSLVHNKLKMQSKGIKSVRARVANIKDELPVPMSVNEFAEGLCNYLKADCEEYAFTDEDIAAIRKLADDKYSSYEWNVGYSPKGKCRFDGRFSFGTLSVTFDMEDGLIRNAEIFGDFFSIKDVKELAVKLNGVRAEKTYIEKALSQAGNYIVGADGAEIAGKLFG